MQVTKAVITAAGRGVRLYPAANTVQKAMIPVADGDGVVKPVIQIIAEEALASGIEEICLVCAPGDEEQYLMQFRLLHDNLLATYRGVEWAQLQAAKIDDLLKRLSFAPQKEPLGYGHAVACAQSAIGDAPFLLLMDDHLYLPSLSGQRCSAQLKSLALHESCAVTAVQPLHESLIRNYGTLTGRNYPKQPGTYEVERIMEKPSVSQAELQLFTPGLRNGFFLCLFGMHILPPSIFSYLDETMHSNENGPGEYQLTPALQLLAMREKYLALEIDGLRYDIGQQFGRTRAEIALALAGKDRDRMLAMLLSLLAEYNQTRE